jgi:valyl-tRNA synthetase
MPFISEEIYQLIEYRKDGESIMVSEMPEAGKVDIDLLKHFEEMKELVSAIRNIRQEKNLSPRNSFTLNITGEESGYKNHFLPLVYKLANIESVNYVEKSEEGAVSFMVRTTEYSIFLDDLLDVDEEKAKLEEELKYQEGFLNSVMKKLSNTNFVNNAPAKVVEMEEKKKADAEHKISTITERLKSLS